MFLLISVSVLGYSSKAFEDIVNSDKSDTEKVKAVLKLDKELKQDAQKINNFKKKYIKKYKKIAIETMKNKNKSNYDKMKAWEDFTNISEGTKFSKSGARMVYKFSKKALRDLDKELKTEELKIDRNYKKIIYILDKILSLKLNKKKITKYQKRRNLYASKLKSTKTESKDKRKDEALTRPKDQDKRSKDKALTRPKDQDKRSKDEALTRPKDEDKRKDEALTHPKDKQNQDKKDKMAKKEDTKKVTSHLSHKHPLAGKSIIEFRALVYNNKIAKVNMLDIANYVGTDSNKKKKLLILTFYANYCKPCKKELPFLNKLYKKYKNKGLIIVAVNTDKDKDEIVEVKEFIKDNALEFPILKDSYNIISRRYSIENFPTMFLVNGNGKILKATIGYDSNEAKLENDIVNLLK